MSDPQRPGDAHSDRHDEEPPGRAGTEQGLNDCADVMLRLFEYVDNEAAAEDGQRIRDHLSACASCLREYEHDVLLKAIVRRACGCQPAPEALRSQILARISSVTVTQRTVIRTYGSDYGP